MVFAASGVNFITVPPAKQMSVRCSNEARVRRRGATGRRVRRRPLSLYFQGIPVAAGGGLLPLFD